MTDKPPFIPATIPFKGAILSFAKLHKAEGRRLKPGQVADPKAPKHYSAEILLDPTNREHQKTIAAIKEDSVRALNHLLGSPENPNPFSVAVLDQVASGERAPPNFHLAWGYGDALPKFGKKIYDGYKGMFFIRIKRKEEDGRPSLLNRAGNAVVEGDPQCPYGGCVAAGVLNVWAYNNQSRGINGNMRTLVYQDKGTPFGKGAIDSEGDFAALGDLGGDAAAGGADGSRADFDPFAIT